VQLGLLRQNCSLRLPLSLTKKRAAGRGTENEIARDRGISLALALCQLPRCTRDLVVHIGFGQTLTTSKVANFRKAP